MSRFLTVAQIAEEYGCGLRTAYRIAEECKPVPTPGGRGIRVERVHFENWIRKQRERRAWDREQGHASYGEEGSGIAGSPSPAVGHDESPPTVRTERPPRPKRGNLSDAPRTRPIKPRTRPLSSKPATSS